MPTALQTSWQVDGALGGPYKRNCPKFCKTASCPSKNWRQLESSLAATVTTNARRADAKSKALIGLLILLISLRYRLLDANLICTVNLNELWKLIAAMLLCLLCLWMKRQFRSKRSHATTMSSWHSAQSQKKQVSEYVKQSPALVDTEQGSNAWPWHGADRMMEISVLRISCWKKCSRLFHGRWPTDCRGNVII